MATVNPIVVLDLEDAKALLLLLGADPSRNWSLSPDVRHALLYARENMSRDQTRCAEQVLEDLQIAVRQAGED